MLGNLAVIEPKKECVRSWCGETDDDFSIGYVEQIHSSGSEIKVHAKTCKQMLIVALFIMAEDKATQMSIDRWLDKLTSGRDVEYS